MNFVSKLIQCVLHPSFLVDKLRRRLGNSSKIASRDAFKYDLKRYLLYSGVFRQNTREYLVAQVIHTYHGLEKGLTMPNRRLNFGHDAVLTLVRLIKQYVCSYGKPIGQVAHAIGVLKAYLIMHKEVDGTDNIEFWNEIHALVDEYPNIKPSIQPHLTADMFYANVNSDFEHFARSRHTLRHYDGPVDEDDIKKAVALAMTAPSACNRQPVRVHCISNQIIKDKVLNLQSGNRGFGKNADKVLIVTGDLSDICWVDERYDLYTNCGIFIMNLCYSLFYYKIAHCILNWSIGVNPQKDIELHQVTGIPDNEVVAAIFTCGKTPNEFDVAQSPRKSVDEILLFHK
jgi:hypothetical protein